ncbi:hypothetical protein B0H10DRAFT_1945214 [Mycena sp. CBHHK59/15]|nr:hypothetical protein B0H10DRAFT_1945214 [Mycena sp. CBHHK59/15]
MELEQLQGSDVGDNDAQINGLASSDDKIESETEGQPSRCWDFDTLEAGYSLMVYEVLDGQLRPIPRTHVPVSHPTWARHASDPPTLLFLVQAIHIYISGSQKQVNSSMGYSWEYPKDLPLGQFRLKTVLNGFDTVSLLDQSETFMVLYSRRVECVGPEHREHGFTTHIQSRHIAICLLAFSVNRMCCSVWPSANSRSSPGSQHEGRRHGLAFAPAFQCTRWSGVINYSLAVRHGQFTGNAETKYVQASHQVGAPMQLLAGTKLQAGTWSSSSGMSLSRLPDFMVLMDQQAIYVTAAIHIAVAATLPRQDAVKSG